MRVHRLSGVAVVAGLVLLVAPFAAAQDRREVLVNVAGGATTTDTGLDNRTRPEIVGEKKLGGNGMKLTFAAGDSIGQRAKVTNWKPFALFQFSVVNPGSAVELELNIVHARSTGYPTRLVIPVVINPGLQEISIALSGLKNVDGTAPDLEHVVRWYLVDGKQQSPTLIFGNIALAGGKNSAGGVGSATVHGDPARVARIRSAKMPAIDQPVMFDTPAADAIMSALEIFPPDNPWNLMVDDWPVHPDSQAIVASIGAAKPLRCNYDMGFVLVPADQKKVAVKLADYSGESDAGPYPVPDNIPIEGWPRSYAESGQKLSLDDVQRDRLDQGGDRHAIVVDPQKRTAYEFYALKKTDNGWQAAQASIFDLASNKLRPDTWTSTDAAGLPLLPSIVRYDELERGRIDHALRVTVERSRKAYVYPATHHAGHADDPSLPRMGERLRLKKDYPLAGFSPAVAAILRGLKSYGMLVADNGLSWSISVAPDPRMPDVHEELRNLKGSDFEVVLAPAGYEAPSD